MWASSPTINRLYFRYRVFIFFKDYPSVTCGARSRLSARSVLLPAAKVSPGHPHPFIQKGLILFFSLIKPPVVSYNFFEYKQKPLFVKREAIFQTVARQAASDDFLFCEYLRITLNITKDAMLAARPPANTMSYEPVKSYIYGSALESAATDRL